MEAHQHVRWLDITMHDAEAMKGSKRFDELSECLTEARFIHVLEESGLGNRGRRVVG